MSLSRTGRRALSIALTTTLAGATVFTLQGTSSAAPSASGTASPTEGTTVVGSVVTVTGAGFKDAAGVANVKAQGAGIPRVVLGSTTCSDASTAAAGAGNAFTFSLVSATKITVTLPTHVAGATKICLPVTNSAGTHVVNAYVAAPYTFAAQPTAGTLDHASGPSYGGQTVVATSTVAWRSGSTSVTVGGLAATNVKVATGGTSLSFVTPATTAGAAQAVVVKTSGFAPVTFAAAYTYQSSIKVSPQIVDPAGDTIDILGSGFSSFTAAGVWVGDASGAEPLCSNVAVVSDTEITCDLAAHTGQAVSIVVGENVDGTLANATSKSAVTSGSTVTFATY
jgi:hypothetical protein